MGSVYRYILSRNRLHNMALNNEQAPVPAPAQVLLTPRLAVYRYITNELYLLCVKKLPPCQDYRIQDRRFRKYVDVATTDVEKNWMNAFLTVDEINIASTQQGLSVWVIDKFENGWALRLKKRNHNNKYILSGRRFGRFKRRQRFTPGWNFHLWVARGNEGQVVMAMDFTMGNQN